MFFSLNILHAYEMKQRENVKNMENKAPQVHLLAEFLPAIVYQILHDLRLKHFLLVRINKRIQHALCKRQHVEPVTNLMLTLWRIVVDLTLESFLVKLSQLHWIAVEGHDDGTRVRMLVIPVVEREMIVEEFRVQKR